MNKASSHALLGALEHRTIENEDGGLANITEMFSHGLLAIANALKLLGNADAATPFGALEALSIEIKESGERIAAGLQAIAEAINDHGASA